MNLIEAFTNQTLETMLLQALILGATVLAGYAIAGRVARKRAARRVSLVQSVRAHPAGRGLMNQPRVLEPTRQLDRVGADWTKF